MDKIPSDMKNPNINPVSITISVDDYHYRDIKGRLSVTGLVLLIKMNFRLYKSYPESLYSNTREKLYFNKLFLLLLHMCYLLYI